MKKTNSWIVTLRGGMLAAIVLAAVCPMSAAPLGKLYWDPLHTGSTGAGGAGTWDASTANWWSGSSAYTWISGTAGSVKTYTDLYFGGAAAGSPYALSLALDSILAPSISSSDLYYFKFNFSGDYTIQSTNAAGTLIGIPAGGKYAYVTMLAAAGNTVTFNSPANRITISSEGNNSTNPSVKFSGGGTFNFQGKITIANTDRNGRVSFGDIADTGMTHVNFLGADANVSASRVWVDNAIVNVDGSYLAIDKNDTNTDAAGIRSALHIGGLASSSAPTAVFNLNSGTVRAIGTTGTARGVMFGYAANSPGGTLNLNGGVLAATSVQVSGNANANTTALLVFNGGTLAALAEGITDGAANYDNQYHLGGFLSGFANTAKSKIVIAEGGAFIDTGAIGGRSAAVASVISGSGNLTKLGANTLRFDVASAHTGATFVNGGTLAATVDNAFAQSAAVGIAAGGVFDAGATAQTLNNLSGAGTLAIGAGGKVTAFNGALDTVFAGVLAGSGAFLKTGDGVLTLDGDNSASTVSIAVSQGALLLGANGKLGGTLDIGAGVTFGGQGAVGNATNVNLASGAHLRVGSFDATSAEILRLGALNLAAGSILDFSVAPGNLSTQLNVTSLALTGGANVSAIVLNFERLASGTYTLGNIASLGGASVQINGAAAGPRQMASVRADGANLVLDATVSASERITWTGGASGTWNRTGTNWKITGGSTPITFADGDSITFDSTSDAADKRAITIAGDYIRVADMTVTGNGNYAFSGAALVGEANASLAGTQGRLSMQGTGTLTLANNGVNEFAGGIELQSGAIRAASKGALGENAISVTGDAGIIFDTSEIVAAGDISIAASKTLTLGATATTAAVISGNISGGALVKNGGGLVVLTAANTHAATTLAGGTLAIAHAGALGSGTVTAGAASVLRVDVENHTINNALNLGSSMLAVDTVANDTAWAGTIAGSGTLGKLGSGTLTVNAGALAAAAGLHIGEGTLKIIPASAGSYNIVNKLSGTGILDMRLSGAADVLTLGAGVASGFSGMLRVQDASFALDGAAVAQLAGASLGVGQGSFVSKGSGAMSMDGISFGGGTFKLASTGTMLDGMLTVNNLHTGAAGVVTTIMVDPAILEPSGTLPNPAPAPQNLFDQDSPFGGIKTVAASHVSGEGMFRLVDQAGNLITASSTVTITQSGAAVADGIYGYGAGALSDGLYVGAVLKTIDIHAGQELILDPDQADSRLLTADITGSGGLVIQTTAPASGTTTIVSGSIITNYDPVVLAGNNTYTGTTRIISGPVAQRANDVFKHSAGVDIGANASLLIAGGYTQTIKQLTGSGTIVFLGGELVMDATADKVMAVAMSGTGGAFTKTGAGTLTLSGNSSRGAGSVTNLNAGKLVVTNLGALSVGTGTFNGAAGTVLEFNGIVGATSNVATVAASGTVNLVNSSMMFRSSGNNIGWLNLINSTLTTNNSVGSLGGYNVNVNVGAGSTLSLTTQPGATLSMRALNVTVENTGRLLFGAFGSVNRLVLGTAGKLTLKDGATIGLAGVVSDGVYTVLESGATVFESNIDAINMYAGPNKGVSLMLTEDNDLAIAKLTTDPRKDISMTFDAMTAAMSTIYSHLSENFLLPFAESGSKTRRDSLWIKGFASFAEYDDTTEQYGHKEDTYGLIVGYDMLTRNRQRMVGLYGGFASSKLDSEGSSTKSDADQQFLGVYGAIKWGKAYLGADVAAGWSQSDNVRRLDPRGSTTNGASDAMWYGASAELGYLFTPAKNFTLKPSIGLHYMNVAFDAYREYGISAVQYPDITQDLLQSIAALQASWKFSVWGRPAHFDLRYGWRENLSATDDDITVFFVERPDLPMTVHSGGYSRGGQMLGVGLRAMVSDMTMIGVGYDFETASGRSRHTLNATVRLSW